MNKFLTSVAVIAALGFASTASARDGWRGDRDGRSERHYSNGIVPFVAGAVIGGLIVESTRPNYDRPYTVYAYPTYSYPAYPQYTYEEYSRPTVCYATSNEFGGAFGKSAYDIRVASRYGQGFL